MDKKLLLETQAFQDMISEMNDQEFSEQYLQEAFINISEDKLEKARVAGEKNIKVIGKVLKDYGINIEYIRIQSNKAVKMMKNMFDQNVPVEKASLKVLAVVGKSIYKKVAKSIKEKSLSKKIIMSLLVFAGVFFVSYVYSGIFVTVGIMSNSYNFYMGIFNCVIAPIIEEIGKRIAVKGKYPFVYVTIFSGLEFLLYYSKMVSLGISVPKIVLVRGLVVAMHFVTTAIQNHYYKKSIEKDDPKIQFNGFVIAVSIHMLYNFFALMYNKEINSFLMG